MIVALLIGREGSIGFPGKNLYPVLGRSLMEYPILAAINSHFVDEVYISTDSVKIKEIGRRYDVHNIDRPAYLCTKEALGDEAFVHGYRCISNMLKREIEIIVLLFCNAATVTSETIDKGVEVLRKDPSIDSAVTVSSYNMWSPIRARKIDEGGFLSPFVSFETFGNPSIINCDRNSQGDVWFADMSVSVVRPHCLENINDGTPPQKWMGKKIYPIKQWAGCDVDFEWQIPVVEYWLKQYGFTESKTPYDESR